MFTRIKEFVCNEDGAVTVDWIVLTAAIVSMGLIIIASVEGGVSTAADSVSKDIVDKTS